MSTELHGALRLEPFEVDDDFTTEVRAIDPPLPAPYLAGAPQLSDELLGELAGHRSLMVPLELRAAAEIESITAQIRFRREAYERQHGVQIVPERPAF